uniref:Retrotransposon Copia-like N-terminal domain-containing protein n=1 Tax=Cannabis sativa TaxID=3483 RepID=A0A803Q937_CANSA
MAYATSSDSTLHPNGSNPLPRSSSLSFNHTFSIKLDENNFLPWRHQVYAAIKGHQLLKFIDLMEAPPYLLVTWLSSSMTEKILTRMVGWNSAAQIWFTLEEYYSAQNRAKVSHFRTQLCHTKLTRNLNDYLLKIKHIVDSLASIGHVLSTQDHIEAIFNGFTQANLAALPNPPKPFVSRGGHQSFSPIQFDTFTGGEDFFEETIQTTPLAMEDFLTTLLVIVISIHLPILLFLTLHVVLEVDFVVVSQVLEEDLQILKCSTHCVTNKDTQ